MEIHMTKIWHKGYDAGVPYEINPNEYSSINDVLEVGFTKFKDLPPSITWEQHLPIQKLNY